VQKEHQITAIGTSEGIVIGKAYIFSSAAAGECFAVSETKISENQIDDEIKRFDDALNKTRDEIETVRSEAAKKTGIKHAQIFDAHLLILEDKVFIDQIKKLITEKHYNADNAFCTIAKKYLKSFENITDKYFRERTADIKDVFHRVIINLTGYTKKSLANLKEDVIVIAHDLSPSETATMHKERVIGMVTEIGGPTSHTAIMARAMEIPAVTGANKITEIIHENDLLIVDGSAGIIIINPSKQQIDKYKHKQQIALERKARLLISKDKPAITIDNHKVSLLANIEIPEEAEHAINQGAEGIGLYRTEFFFMNQNGLPSEDEQYEAYAHVARVCGDKPVVIRTLDLGGDKFASALSIPNEMNPFMGWRAIRMCLERTDIFKTQLRAILRASETGNVRIMFPMIATIQEVREAKKIVEEAKNELRKEGKAFNENIQIGVMIEIPSAVMISDILARETDFFSIGTNDLIQYCLAVDRVNEKTAHMYDPLNVAIIRMIKLVIDAAHNVSYTGGICDKNIECPFAWNNDRKPIKVCVCGEIASEPILAYLLLGLGVDELSTASISIPQNKQLLRASSYQNAKKIASDSLRKYNSDDVKNLLINQILNLNLEK